MGSLTYTHQRHTCPWESNPCTCPSPTPPGPPPCAATPAGGCATLRRSSSASRGAGGSCVDAGFVQSLGCAGEEGALPLTPPLTPRLTPSLTPLSLPLSLPSHPPLVHPLKGRAYWRVPLQAGSTQGLGAHRAVPHHFLRVPQGHTTAPRVPLPPSAPLPSPSPPSPLASLQLKHVCQSGGQRRKEGDGRRKTKGNCTTSSILIRVHNPQCNP